ncbi:hypothetical protein hrd7_15540 [Leptolinea sp. HRD-7]|nr:hypothetical protein hrd7_15540 [Leptolinea sp. HRD-7]
MLKIDYTLERDISGDIEIFKPKDLPKEFESNVLYIKAPNASGKSTLLNLIALGLFGNKLSTDEIDPVLKNRIIELQSSSRQKVIFDICIDNPEMGLSILSSKKNRETQDISVIKKVGDKSTQLSAETFFKEFRVIYDIPQKPLERLPQLISEIQTKQNDLGNRIGLLKDFLRTKIEEIRNSKDPNILSDLENKRKQLIDELENNEKDLKAHQFFLENLNTYFLTRTYVSLYDRLEESKKRYAKVKEEISCTQVKGTKIAKKQTEISNQIKESINTCRTLFFGTRILLEKILPNNEKDRFILWDQSSIDDEVNFPQNHHTLRNQSNYFVTLLDTLIEKEKISDSLESERYEVYERLISILSDARFSDLTLPGFNQTVSSFLGLLSEEIKIFQEKNKNIKDLSLCKENLSRFIQQLEKTIDLISEFRETEAQDPDPSYINIQARTIEQEQLKRFIAKSEADMFDLRKTLVANGIDPLKARIILNQTKQASEISTYLDASDIQLSKTIEEFTQRIHSYKDRIEAIQRNITIKTNLISEMNNRETHPYYQYLNRIEVLFQYVQRLEQRFKNQFMTYAKHSKEITSGGILTQKLQENEMRYLDNLGIYLGKKIGHVRHIESEYKIQKLNLLKSSIIVEDLDKKVIEIMFSDLSTGQSQSMYLRSKLNLNDNKKIIALFDEVATMDETSLKPIKDKLKELYYEKKLLLAIIVQKGEKVEITSLL